MSRFPSPARPQRPGRDRQNEGGFSLLELLIAMTVTIIALTGLVSLHSVTTQSSRAAAQFSEASGFARGAIEDLRSRSIPATETTFGPLPIIGVTMDTVNGRSGLTYTRRLWVEPTTASIDLIRIAVEVSWTESGAVAGAENGRYDHRVRLELVRTRLEAL